MRTVSEADIAARLRADNPWWSGAIDTNAAPYGLPKRDYFDALKALAQSSVKRAVVLLGARRVGKTTLLHQLIGAFVQDKRFPAILFVSIDTPIFTGLSLAKLMDFFEAEAPHDPRGERLVIFDEIQYLKDWERHLKDLVDRNPHTRFIVSGSAGAALKRQSTESGAGRFTDFELPPLTFAEYVRFRKLEAELIVEDRSRTGLHRYAERDINALNAVFLDYINFGGFPEAVYGGEAVRANFKQFIGRDIIDKVLLRDLPSLYGIQDIQELNRLFSVIAYNTGQEISLEGLAQNSGVAKNTIQRYLEYLETAFLIHRVQKIDQSAKRFQRQRHFKVYLTNPSMRTALFDPVAADDVGLGALAETAIFCQWIHSPELRNLYYARWANGEVDVVRLDPKTQKPTWAYDVKWSDHHIGRNDDLKSLISFATKCGMKMVGVSTKTARTKATIDGIEVRYFPLAVQCYALARVSASEPAVLNRLGVL